MELENQYLTQAQDGGIRLVRCSVFRPRLLNGLWFRYDVLVTILGLLFRVRACMLWYVRPAYRFKLNSFGCSYYSKMTLYERH